MEKKELEKALLDYQKKQLPKDLSGGLTKSTPKARKVDRIPEARMEPEKIVKLKKNFQTDWMSFRKYGDESPMQTYFREVDLAMVGTLYSDLWKYAMNEDIIYMSNLLVEDWKFRSDARMNIVASIEGALGQGKSLSSIYFALLLGKIFGKPFVIDNLVFTPEELDQKIENAEWKSIFIMDEQRRANLGAGSLATQLRLQDYEETMRYAQLSLIYNAPTLREHIHFFVFETHKINRVSYNEKCVGCEKNCKECEDLPPHERVGYPKSFLLMLKTRRLMDGLLIPRGLIEIPMPNPEIVKEYDVKKEENVKMIQRKEEARWKIMMGLAERVWDRYKTKIIIKTKKGTLRVAPQRYVKIFVMQTIGQGRLTKEEVEMLITLIQSMAEEHIIKECGDIVEEGEENV